MRLQVAVTEKNERLGPTSTPVMKFSVSQRYGVIPSDELENRTMQAKSLEKYKVVAEDDLVLNRFNAYKGALGLAPGTGVVSPDYFVAVVNPTLADARFIRYFLLAQPSAEIIRRDMGGMGSGDPDSSAFARFDVRSLLSMEVAIDDLGAQRAIADYLDRETAEIDAMTADLDELETLLIERRRGTVETILLGGGTTTLQSLPEDWSRTTLGTVFSFHNGDRGVNYPRPEDISDEGIPFINAGDLINGTVDLEGCKRVSPEKYAQMGGAKLQRGDILFCLRGSLGKWGLMESDGGSLASSLCALRNERPDLVDVRYIAHAMSTRVISLQIWFNESGSAQPNLGAEQVARFRVPLPPLEEQHRIVDEIDRETAEIDAMLADITELRDLLAERRAAVIAAAVTGQIDIPAAEETTHA